jgi:hypothetical protein
MFPRLLPLSECKEFMTAPRRTENFVDETGFPAEVGEVRLISHDGDSSEWICTRVERSIEGVEATAFTTGTRRQVLTSPIAFYDQYTRRYKSYEDALYEHEKICESLRPIAIIQGRYGFGKSQVFPKKIGESTASEYGLSRDERRLLECVQKKLELNDRIGTIEKALEVARLEKSAMDAHVARVDQNRVKAKVRMQAVHDVMHRRATNRGVARMPRQQVEEVASRYSADFERELARMEEEIRGAFAIPSDAFAQTREAVVPNTACGTALR